MPTIRPGARRCRPYLAGIVAAAVARAFLRKYVGREVERARALGGSPASGDDQADVWTWRIDPTGALFTLEYPIENLRGAENAVV